MLCQNCKKKQASIHFVKVINGKKTEMHLCDECAPQKEIGGFGSFGFGIGDILGGMLGGTITHNRLVCDMCKTDYDTFSKTGKLGCSKCYEVFEEYLDAPLKRIHGSSKYLGKTPKKHIKEEKSAASTVSELKKKLADAIKKEDFESAAKLRDEIRAIEGGDNK